MLLLKTLVFTMCLGSASFHPVIQTAPVAQVNTLEYDHYEDTPDHYLFHAKAEKACIHEVTKAEFILNDRITEEKGNKYYIRNGKKLKSAWVSYQGHTYYASATGKLLTGWLVKDGNTYFFDKNGRLKTGWIYDDHNWYYSKENGIVTGWQMIPDADATEKWYYFEKETGRMVTDDITPDGYYVNADGVWIDKLVFPDYDGVFSWEQEIENREPGTISGLEIADMPAEFYMLTIAGETSGGANKDAIVNGDRGRAYGFCQFDYRYDLVGFMNYAYNRHPELWEGFAPYLSLSDGDSILIGNTDIGDTFLKSTILNAEVSMDDQLSYIRSIYWDKFASKLNRAGYRLDERHIAVSAAFLSVNVNCGPQAVLFLSLLNPEMTDEEIIIQIYRIRNIIMSEQYVETVKKGTTPRYMESEPRMALDLLYGYVTIDSVVNYGGGVEWHGNPFSSVISTIENEKTETENMDLWNSLTDTNESQEEDSSEFSSEPVANFLESQISEEKETLQEHIKETISLNP